MSIYSFRTTTNGVLRNYRSNLNKSYSRLNTAMTRVQTQRKFNTYAENPSAASRGFQLRRALWRNNDQLDNTNNAISKFQTAFSAVASICDGDSEHKGLNGIEASLQVIHDPTGGSRVSLGQELYSEADGIMQMMNATYNESFVFAGADGKNVPFTWSTTDQGTKKLLYRGIDVDTPDPRLLTGCQTEHDEQMEKLTALEAVPAAFAPRAETTTDPDTGYITEITTQSNGTIHNQRKIVKDAGGTVLSDVQVTLEKLSDNRTRKTVVEAGGPTTVYEAEITQTLDGDGNTVVTRNTTVTMTGGAPKVYTQTDTVLTPENAFAEKYGMSYGQAQENYATLQKYLGETTYVDIGLGMAEDENGPVPTSAFDTALHGLKFISWGMDEDGDPKNVVSIMRELGAIACRCDPDSGAFASDEDCENANRLTNKLRAAINRVSEAHVEISARCTFLNSNVKLLEVTQGNLDEQRANVEDIGPALAISEMNYANYCYNAALKIGNSILSQSLLDYMR